jgi:hypothetical protein
MHRTLRSQDSQIIEAGTGSFDQGNLKDARRFGQCDSLSKIALRSDVRIKPQNILKPTTLADSSCPVVDHPAETIQYTAIVVITEIQQTRSRDSRW